MPVLARIAIACSDQAERTIVSAWLTEAGYVPVVLDGLSRLEQDLQSNAIEALIVDTSLVAGDADLRAIVRRLGINRPLVFLGDATRLPSASHGESSIIGRPLERERFLLSVGLALAEGRPSRRFPRRRVEPVSANVQGMAVTIVETSAGGVGLDLSGARSAVLPPYFSLRIPEFGVHVAVRRAWMAPAGPGRTRCGGTVEGDLTDAARPWAEFAREAPPPTPTRKRSSF